MVHVPIHSPNATGIAGVSLLWEGDQLIEGWIGPASIDPRMTRAVPTAPARLERFNWFRYASDTLQIDAVPDPSWLGLAGRRFRRRRN